MEVKLSSEENLVQVSKEKSKKSRVLITILIVFVVLLGYGVFRIYGFTPLLKVEEFFLNLFSPIAGFFQNIASKISSFVSILASIGSISKKIELLDHQNRVLKVKIALVENYIEENIRLKSLLDIKDDYESRCIFAEIVSRDSLKPDNFTVNKGLTGGLKINGSVVYPINIPTSSGSAIKIYQLVGRVYELTDRNAKVLSILDPTSKISARNLRTNSLGTVLVDNKKKMLYFEVRKDEPQIKKGDLIVTSEFSTLSKGLLIGIAESIEDTPSIYRKVYLNIPLNFYKITEVAII